MSAARRGVHPWWRGAIIYQVYPLSFQDTNGDGIGDLPGITRRLDHIAELGADALWLSPFYRSPLHDFGYDVADHTAVDPVFGALEDFDELVQAAHDRGLKVLIDLVLSHTSSQHPWFEESRASRENPRADWYVWADPKADGTPPNNWMSEFGGSAWSWSPERRQYYLHNFLSTQPDLNLHSLAVQQALLQVADFWLARGVDGFRLDAVQCYFHDPHLRNNPPHPDKPSDPATQRFKPRQWQFNRYNEGRPEVVGFLKQIRALADRYTDVVTLAEVGGDEGVRTAAAYVRGRNRLQMAYTFSLLGRQLSPSHIEQTQTRFAALAGQGWPCLTLGNHDVARAATRLADGVPEAHRLAHLKMIWSLLFSLRGSVALYQGDELGLPQPELPRARLRDPYALTFWPAVVGRDGARTPMPWQADHPHGGFSEIEPWMPMSRAHRALSAEAQAHDDTSVCSSMQRFLHWRRKMPALIEGDQTFLEAPTPWLAFERRLDPVRLLILVNFSPDPRTLPLTEALAPWAVGSLLEGHGHAADHKEAEITLPPYGYACMALGVED